MHGVISKGGVNKVILAGRIVNEPQIHLKNNEKWLHFMLQTIETLQSSRGNFQHKELHQIKLDCTNSNVKYTHLLLNTTVQIQGKIHTRHFIDESERRHYRTEIYASNVEVFEL